MQLFNTFLQLCLAALTFAAPIADEISIQKDNAWQYGTGGGILGFIILIIDIIVWVEVIQSTRPVSHKLLWSLLVFIFPIVGAIVYFLFSNREAHKSGQGYEAIP